MMALNPSSTGGLDCLLFPYHPAAAWLDVDCSHADRDIWPFAELESPLSSSEAPAAGFLRAELPPLPSSAVTMAEDLQDLVQCFWDSSGSSSTVGVGGAVERDCGDDGRDAGEQAVATAEPCGEQAPSTGSPPSPTTDRKRPHLTIPEEKDNYADGNKRKRAAGVRAASSPATKVADVAYPFTMVRAGGGEDAVTLADINRRILMRPARPVRHPVGEFASAPRATAGGAGPSGKTVASLTRIHTRGRGTITIIRTRG